MKLDTVKIKADTSAGYAIINKETFDSSKHEIFIAVELKVPKEPTPEPEVPKEPVHEPKVAPKRKPGRPPASRKV